MLEVLLVYILLLDKIYGLNNNSLRVSSVRLYFIVSPIENVRISSKMVTQKLCFTKAFKRALHLSKELTIHSTL